MGKQAKQAAANATQRTKPAGWQPVVGGVKQACWCGHEWGEGHEDAAVHDEHSESEQEQTESSEEELEEGWTKGWYGPVRCQE
jgi:hypothetical protein